MLFCLSCGSPQIISELGLVKCENTMVGNELIRGVSGGERKRLNIGTELVTDPSLVFLDEPTSGLDSFSAQSVMQMLLKLAKNSRTIVTTIHQPRSSIFQMFDSLMLLSEGRCMYFGPAQESIAYFTRLGFACPPNFNPGDYFMDILSRDFRSPHLDQVTKLRVKVLGDAYNDHVAKQAEQTELHVAQLVQKSSAATAAWELENTEQGNYASSWLEQFKQLSVRSFRSL